MPSAVLSASPTSDLSGCLSVVERGFDHSVKFASHYGAVVEKDGAHVLVPAEDKMILKVQNKAGVSMGALDTPVLIVTLSSADLQKLGVRTARAKEIFAHNLSAAQAVTNFKGEWLSDESIGQLRKQLDAVCKSAGKERSLGYNFLHADRSFDRFVKLVKEPDLCSPQDRWLGSHLCVAICASGSNGKFGEIAMPAPGPAGRVLLETEVPLDDSPTFTLQTADDIWYLGSAGWTEGEVTDKLAVLGITRRHVNAVFSGQYARLLKKPLNLPLSSPILPDGPGSTPVPPDFSTWKLDH